MIESLSIRIKLLEEQKLAREEHQALIDALKDIEKKYNDPGPFLDCIVWYDGEKWMSVSRILSFWEFNVEFYFIDIRACIDTSEQGKLDQCQCLTNYSDSQNCGRFSAIGNNNIHYFDSFKKQLFFSSS